MIKHNIISSFVLALALGLSMSANATSEIKVCAKYQRSNYSWSQGYKVNALKVTGDELNKSINSYKFASYDYYLVIPWNEGGYTLLKLNGSWEPSSFDKEYQDQRSITWKVKEGWNWCE